MALTSLKHTGIKLEHQQVRCILILMTRTTRTNTEEKEDRVVGNERTDRGEENETSMEMLCVVISVPNIIFEWIPYLRILNQVRVVVPAGTSSTTSDRRRTWHRRRKRRRRRRRRPPKRKERRRVKRRETDDVVNNFECWWSNLQREKKNITCDIFSLFTTAALKTKMHKFIFLPLSSQW